jgi:hypothetical protein
MEVTGSDFAAALFVIIEGAFGFSRSGDGFFVSDDASTFCAGAVSRWGASIKCTNKNSLGREVASRTMTPPTKTAEMWKNTERRNATPRVSILTVALAGQLGPARAKRFMDYASLP